MDLGYAISYVRRARRMTQGEIAEHANITTGYLSLIERGHRDPALSTVKDIANALGIPMYLLFYLAEEDYITFEEGLIRLLNVELMHYTIGSR